MLDQKRHGDDVKGIGLQKNFNLFDIKWEATGLKDVKCWLEEGMWLI